jgi:nicotinate phosphoribosyltransferase
VRRILDAGGLADVTIFASGGLDEDQVAALIEAKAPIDGFGIGTSLTTSSDAPALDIAYKLQDYAGAPRRKQSAGKETWPGRKQVWRRYDRQGRMTGDVVSLEGDSQRGEPLLSQVMRSGKPTLDAIRAHAASELAKLPGSLRALDPGAVYTVEIGKSLQDLAASFDRCLNQDGKA